MLAEKFSTDIERRVVNQYSNVDRCVAIQMMAGVHLHIQTLARENTTPSSE